MTNILSIDWDYFVAPKEDKYTAFMPDGHDFGIELSTLIWENYYSESCMKHFNVKKQLKTNPKEIKFINDYLSQLMPLKTMIVNSHKHIYDFITNSVEEGDDINLVNIDFHHDYFYSVTEELDCGNWLSYIMDYYSDDSEYTWIRREASQYDNIANNLNIITDLKKVVDILGMDVDLLFICKSYTWSAPHLDKRFATLFKPLLQKCLIQMQEKDIFIDRYALIKKSLQEKEDFGVSQMDVNALSVISDSLQART